MTELTLIPDRGNVSGRFYPHEGYLGLSDVVCRGRIVTMMPKLARPLDASKVTVTVRCYETRQSGPFDGVENVLWEKTDRIWTAPEDTAPVGDWQHPFEITIPPEAMDQAASALYTGEWRVVWRLEAAIHHRPIPHVGHILTKAFMLNLYNHRVPDIPPLSPPAAIILGHDVYTTQLHVTAPPRAFGPSDILPIAFHVRPEDPSTAIRKATITLIRQLEFLDKSPKRSAREVSPEASSRFALFRKSTSPQPRLVRIPPDTAVGDTTEPARTISAVMAEVTTDRFEPGSGGTYWCTTAIQLPPRGRGWDMGETQRTKLVCVSYELKIKLHIRPSKPRMAERDFAAIGVPVVIVTTSSAERAAAVGYEALAAKVVQRKRRSTRRGLYMHEGTTDIDHPAAAPAPAMRTRSRGPLLPVTGVATNVKPILRKADADHPPVEQSISFYFPSPSPTPTPTPTPMPMPIPISTATAAATAMPTPMSTPLEASSSSSPSASSSSSLPLAVPGVTPPTPCLTQGTLSPSVSGPSLLLSPPSGGGDLVVDLDSTCPSPPAAAPALERFQQTGRRISTTSTEDDAQQPSRSRQRLSLSFEDEVQHLRQIPGQDKFLGQSHGPGHHLGHTSSAGQGHHILGQPQGQGQHHILGRPQDQGGNGNQGPDPPTGTGQGGDFRPSLPSLSALGLGLPHVPARPRQSRPSTAPALVGAFSQYQPLDQGGFAPFPAARPVTSWGGSRGLAGMSVALQHDEPAVALHAQPQPHPHPHPHPHQQQQEQSAPRIPPPSHPHPHAVHSHPPLHSYSHTCQPQTHSHSHSHSHSNSNSNSTSHSHSQTQTQTQPQTHVLPQPQRLDAPPTPEPSFAFAVDR